MAECRSFQIEDFDLEGGSLFYAGGDSAGKWSSFYFQSYAVIQ